MPTPEDLTIPDKLDSLKATKQAIRQAIEAKGVTVPTDATFYEYSDSIAEISTGTPLPEGGTAGQVLTKTEDGIAWQDAQGGEEYVLPLASPSALGGIKGVSFAATGGNEPYAEVQIYNPTEKGVVGAATSSAYGVVKFASNEDFCAYMGIEYNESDWT